MRDLYEKTITRNKLRSKLTEIDKIKSEITSLLDKLYEVEVSPSMRTMGMAQSLLRKDRLLTQVAEKMVLFQSKLDDKVLLNSLRRRLQQNRDRSTSPFLPNIYCRCMNSPSLSWSEVMDSLRTLEWKQLVPSHCLS